MIFSTSFDILTHYVSTSFDSFIFIWFIDRHTFPLVPGKGNATVELRVMDLDTEKLSGERIVTYINHVSELYILSLIDNIFVPYNEASFQSIGTMDITSQKVAVKTNWNFKLDTIGLYLQKKWVPCQSIAYLGLEVGAPAPVSKSDAYLWEMLLLKFSTSCICAQTVSPTLVAKPLEEFNFTTLIFFSWLMKFPLFGVSLRLSKCFGEVTGKGLWVKAWFYDWILTETQNSTSVTKVIPDQVLVRSDLQTKSAIWHSGRRCKMKWYLEGAWPHNPKMKSANGVALTRRMPLIK